MTVLQRTDLTTSQKIQCAAAAVAGQHAHGSKTALSETYEISRPTVYAVGAAAESVLRSHFETPLLQGAAVDVRVDDAQLRRAVVALRVLAPNAIRPIEDLVPLLYPGVKVSYGTIQQMLVEAEGRAARFNAQVSLGGVEAGALDEMFSQGEPVLAGVDLDSGYLFGLSLSATRDGEAWAGLLRTQGLGLSTPRPNTSMSTFGAARLLRPKIPQEAIARRDEPTDHDGSAAGIALGVGERPAQFWRWRKRACCPGSRRWPSPGRRILACICWYLVRALHKRPARARYRALYRHLLAAYGTLQDQLRCSRPSRRCCTRPSRLECHRGVQCGTAPLSLCAQRCHPGFSRPVPCLVQSAHAALGTAQGDQRSRVPDRTAGPRLAHAARLSALADTALIRRALPRPRVIGHPRPRALRAAGQARSCV